MWLLKCKSCFTRHLYEHRPVCGGLPSCLLFWSSPAISLSGSLLSAKARTILGKTAQVYI